MPWDTSELYEEIMQDVRDKWHVDDMGKHIRKRTQHFCMKVIEKNAVPLYCDYCILGTLWSCTGCEQHGFAKCTVYDFTKFMLEKI